jgi:hypothetical protein
MLTTVVSLPTSAFPPLALGFMGLGTGYLIYGLQELAGYPRRNPGNDVATGIWGVWLPGFFQFVAGVILFLGLALFGTFKAAPLYMAALAFTAYGIHWFAIGWIRIRGNSDSRVNVGMTIGFTAISVLGTLVFLGAHDDPVAGVFIGLICVYVADFFASLKPGLPKFGAAGERALGFFHLGTGCWLLYMMFAVTLDYTIGYHWIT